MSYLFADGNGGIVFADDSDQQAPSTALTVSLWWKSSTLNDNINEPLVVKTIDASWAAYSMYPWNIESFIGMIGATDTSWYNQSGTTNYTLKTGAWTNLMLTYDGSNVRTWADNVENGSARAATSKTIRYSGGTLRIGEGLVGRIAEVAIWTSYLDSTARQSVLDGDNPTTVSSGSLCYYVPLRDDANEYLHVVSPTVGSGVSLDGDHPTVDEPSSGSTTPIILLRSRQIGLSGLSL